MRIAESRVGKMTNFVREARKESQGGRLDVRGTRPALRAWSAGALMILSTEGLGHPHSSPHGLVRGASG